MNRSSTAAMTLFVACQLITFHHGVTFAGERPFRAEIAKSATSDAWTLDSLFDASKAIRPEVDQAETTQTPLQRPDARLTQASPTPQQESIPHVETTNVAQPPALDTFAVPSGLDEWLDTKRLASTLQLVATMTVVGLVPALLMMTTSYVRIAIVLSLLRQAFGTQQLIPAQATTALAVFCTGLIMWPTWSAVHRDGVKPMLAATAASELPPIMERGIRPIREFMIQQIQRNGNSDDVHLFLQRIPSTADNYPMSYEEVPLRALMPGFLLSELKTAFLIGFQIYLPFLVIDLVVATFATSLGMFMLPPAMISLPLKLLMFVMVDGWHRIVEMLLRSFV